MFKKFADYYTVNSKEHHVYLSTVETIIDKIKNDLRQLKAQHQYNGDTEIAKGIELAINELCFINTDIMALQLKKINNEK